MQSVVMTRGGLGYFLAAVLCTAVAGCASQPSPDQQWQRFDTGPEQVAFDHRQCEVEVEQAANGETFENPAVRDPQALEDLRERQWRREAFYRCMVDRGYRLLDTA